jgi:recombination DNA repair RAD52 pathway protein
MAFTTAQLRQLKAKLDPKHIKTRKASVGVHYLEGWHAIAEANRIFGFDGWDRETVSTSCVWSGKERSDYTVAYAAKVRVSVRAGETLIVGKVTEPAKLKHSPQAKPMSLR